MVVVLLANLCSIETASPTWHGRRIGFRARRVEMVKGLILFLLHHDRAQLVVLQLAHVRRVASEFFLIDHHPLCYLRPNSTDTSSRFHMLLMHHVKLRSRCRISKLNRHRYLHLSCRSNTTSSHHENRLESHLTAHQPQSSFQHPKYGDVVLRFSFPASPRFTSFIPVLAQTNNKPRYGIAVVREPPP